MMLEISAPELARRRWTRAECHALHEAGALNYEKFELLDGVLVPRMGKNMPHVRNAMSFLWRLADAFGREFVSMESPVSVSEEDGLTNEPEPDLIVLARPVSSFSDRPPQAIDVRLLIEISDSTLAFDLGDKANLYARATISDYWVFDATARRIIVHREPVGGEYRSVRTYAAHEPVSPLADPSISFRAIDL